MKNLIINYKVENVVNKVIIAKDIENHLLKDLVSLKSDKKILFIYDENINNQFIKKILDNIKLSGGNVISQKVKGSKKNKSLKNLLFLFNILIKNNFSKKSVIVSCGGGVIGDLTGLLSSLYLRGTIYFHIPSTMTAIVDSCLGGKTGINYKDVINSFGNYYHPNRVYISERVLKSLPNREYNAGISEILKCGLLGNKKILTTLKLKKDFILKRNFKILSILIYETLKTKITHFINDVKESKKRLNLNFGHTFAHAIEMATDQLVKKDYFRHGEAVGIGILCEIALSNMNKPKEKNELYKLTSDILKSYHLPIKIELPSKVSKLKVQNMIYKNIFLDKKRISSNPRYINLKKVGKPIIKEVEDLNSINEIIYGFLD